MYVCNLLANVEEGRITDVFLQLALSLLGSSVCGAGTYVVGLTLSVESQVILKY